MLTNNQRVPAAGIRPLIFSAQPDVGPVLCNADLAEPQAGVVSASDAVASQPRRRS